MIVSRLARVYPYAGDDRASKFKTGLTHGSPDAVELRRQPPVTDPLAPSGRRLARIRMSAILGGFKQYAIRGQ